MQNDVLAVKDAELEQASAALTSKVRLFYIGSDLLRQADAPTRVG
jgi:hypothetical protein